jgi:2-keto-4-pentenoate hydratase/2-oxohepta-3-ene-1,7-dioic acid hydratase in catechol pathway
MRCVARYSLMSALLLLLASSLAEAQASVKYVRYRTAAGAVSYGVLEGERVRRVEGDIFGQHRVTTEAVPVAQVRLLAPVVPSKVICVGLNYRSHLGGATPAAEPGLFAKYPTSIIGPNDTIMAPPDSKNLHYEGELVVVIGKRAKNVAPQDVASYIFGVTAGNDVSERDWQRSDLQWFRAKAGDTFAPLGPVLVTGLNYNDLLVQTRVNGETRQSERTKDLLFDVSAIISYLSRYITLMPGDVVYTGTPQTTRAMNPGDVVEIEVEGVGVLRNVVARGK